jgi:broad specificity phosphatase PhoE
MCVASPRCASFSDRSAAPRGAPEACSHLHDPSLFDHLFGARGEKVAPVTTDSTLPSLVLLVRHGATDWSMSGRHTGRTDLPLNALGVRQATAVRPLIAQLLGGQTPLVFSSPLTRAAETARLAWPEVTPVLDEALLELDYGQLEGLTTREILEQHPQWNLFADGCPGGEHPDAVTARCDAFTQTVLRRAPGRAVVAFTHGHLSRALTARLLGLPLGTAAALYNQTASVGVINVHRGRWVLVGWNLEAKAAETSAS